MTTGRLAAERRNLLATANAIHRAVDFLETKNVTAYHKAMLIAVHEPGRFESDEKYAEAFEASEAHATIVAEMEELEQTAFGMAFVAKASGQHALAAKLAIATKAAMQFRYASVVDAGALAREAADMAKDAASALED